MLRYLEVLVEEGDYIAARYLAQAWDEGLLGLPKDSATAFEYFLKAANSGDGWSQYCVATQYAQGCGVEQNDELAVFWYQKAADQGVGLAQSNLGFSHEIGRPPLTRAMSEANHWYRLAAMNNVPEGKFNLAQSYRHGKGLPANCGLAHEWFLSAAQDGHSEAAYCAAHGYELGLGVARNWPEALRWYARALELGHAGALKAFECLAWRVDGATETVVRNESARHVSQDICAVITGEQGTLVLLADGAGGGGYGKETAEALGVACQERLTQGVPENFDWADWLEDIDRQLASGGPGGQAAVVLLWLSNGVVSGASVGNSQAWLVRVADVFPLTALQAFRPLLGSGTASVTALGPCLLEGRLVVASDGLWHRISASRIEVCARQSHAAELADALITAARLPNGELVDDVSLIVIAPRSM
ncbi:hypothetical protein [Niveibacterium sp.]|uniref:hypothetical protein n=1 Tax=Niveibacterium sp. TaxID=2017444 RepID=UPI0035AF5B07